MSMTQLSLNKLGLVLLFESMLILTDPFSIQIKKAERVKEQTSPTIYVIYVYYNKISIYSGVWVKHESRRKSRS